MKQEEMKPTTVATVRTTWNMTILTALTGVLYKAFGWKLTVDDILPFLPIIAPAIAIFYRACRALAAKWPIIGTILFGLNAIPTSYEPPKP